MQLDPVIVVRDTQTRKEVVVLQTFDDIRRYIGADHQGPKIGIVATVANADCPYRETKAIDDFIRWARIAELLVTLVPADEVNLVLA